MNSKNDELALKLYCEIRKIREEEMKKEKITMFKYKISFKVQIDGTLENIHVEMMDFESAILLINQMLRNDSDFALFQYKKGTKESKTWEFYQHEGKIKTSDPKEPEEMICSMINELRSPMKEKKK